MWIVCITSVRHVLTVNGYGGRQTKENEKSWCFKGWETLVNNIKAFIYKDMKRNATFKVLLMFIVGLFLSVNTFAQQIVVKGIVKDTTGEPIIGANVIVKERLMVPSPILMATSC